MKKILLTLLIAVISLQLFGCMGGGDNEVKPEYSSVYSMNDNYHWRAQTNGTGRTDYAAHKNDKGKCVCGKYYDSSSVLTYTKKTIDGELAYEVSAYDKNSDIVHVEIPSVYKAQGDAQPLPVLVIAEGCFKASELRSIKLNEGLRYINRTAFSSTFITEIDIPDSVLGQQKSVYPYSGGLYNTFGECGSLVRVKIGNGVSIIESHTFASCKNLSEVELGSSVTTIGIRAFYECKSLNEIVLPESVNYIPEGEIFTPAVGYITSLNRCFTYASRIYMNITKEELRDLTVPLYERDRVTGEVIPDNIQRNPGFCEGWAGMADIIYKGEWKYDQNGKPVEI
ncbi:MAG: leucine-rich repeat domain-containing protein [Clostridia bacterium]|nr:leucine-rich repeat domain-containing protein [Clostridia bacterium]